MKKNEILREIPQVEKLLQTDEINRFVPLIGHGLVIKIIREQTEAFRQAVLSGESSSPDDLYSSIVEMCLKKRLEKMQRVINGTGVIIHTNLGRSPISSEILSSLSETVSGYCNLEFHLPSQKRGKRGGMAEELIADLTGAEDAIIVNNNASSVFLILNQFASGKEAVVSRGELIQIGGGFRIPDIMRQTGVKLVEVGTTNITTLDDYKNAITSETSMVFSAHTSNYKIEGFTKSPSLQELASLRSESVLFVRDLGSGNLVYEDLPVQPFEPTINYELSQGPDLLCFSGDKLLGAGQAGIIIGKRELIAQLRKNPLMRMIRVDKITYYLLQETLIKYQNNKIREIALWDIILQKRERLNKKVNSFLKRLSSEEKKFVRKINTKNTFGGGAMPTVENDSLGVAIEVPEVSVEIIYTAFIREEVPIVGTIVDNRFVLDFMTVFETDIPRLAASVSSVIGSNRRA